MTNTNITPEIPKELPVEIQYLVGKLINEYGKLNKCHERGGVTESILFELERYGMDSMALGLIYEGLDGVEKYFMKSSEHQLKLLSDTNNQVRDKFDKGKLTKKDLNLMFEIYKGQLEASCFKYMGSKSELSTFFKLYELKLNGQQYSELEELIITNQNNLTDFLRKLSLTESDLDYEQTHFISKHGYEINCIIENEFESKEHEAYCKYRLGRALSKIRDKNNCPITKALAEYGITS